MIYKYTSAKATIAKVYRDMRIGDADWIMDAIEWIGEALDAIGAIIYVSSKSEVLKVYSHKAPLPYNFVKIEQVRYGTSNSDKEESPDFEDFPYVLPYNTGYSRAHLIDSDPSDGVQMHRDQSYFIENGYITTSFEEDWICILYKAVELDEDGFPMVPDNFSFSQAMYWYIVMKLLEGGKQHPAGIPWITAEERWLKYCTQARSKAMMPDEAKSLEILKNWLTFLPNYQYDSMAETFNRQAVVDPYIFRTIYPENEE